MPGSVTIRPARADEHRQLEDLQRAASLAVEEDRADLLAHPDAIALPPEQIDVGAVHVAEGGGEIAGFSVLLLHALGEWELDGLFVAPRCWRGGVGTALIAHARQFAAGRGASAITVVAGSSAVPFYEACGFRVTGEAATRFGPAPRMRLTLS